MSVRHITDIEKEIAKRTNYRTEDIKQVVELVFPIIMEMLLADDEVTIKRFGRFSLLKKQPRLCTDARTGKKTMSNFKAVIKFRQSVKMAPRLAILTNPEYDWGDEEE